MRTLVGVLVLVLALPGAVRAQPAARAPASPTPAARFAVISQDTVEESAAAEDADLMIGGLVGGGLGMVFGGLLAASLSNGPHSALAGLIVGESVGVAVGTHVANDGRGELGLSALASTALAVGGIVALQHGGSRSVDYGIVFAVGVSQVALTRWIESSTSDPSGAP